MTASASAPAQRSGVIAPYGGTLVDLMEAEADRAAVKATATKTIECSDRNACDVELLCVCLLYTSPSPRDRQKSRMPSSA